MKAMLHAAARAVTNLRRLASPCHICLTRVVCTIIVGLVVALTSAVASAQSPVPTGRATPMPQAPPPAGPAPTVRDIAYARSDVATGHGHLLDLYLPVNASTRTPVVIFTHGSGWLADNGREDAQVLAAVLLPAGYAVAGVAVRSSAQAQFPGQLHDIKAAIRWLRTNGAKYRLDPEHIGIVGESSGGWTAAMAAVTGDVPELEGSEGTTGVSSAVQAAVAFYPPTDFLQMDAWALRPCDPTATLGRGAFCHDSPTSPESRFLGCELQRCPDKAASASPLRYISRADGPLMIFHGEADAIVPHAQGERLYQALNKACHDAVFISLPVAGHGTWHAMLTDPAVAAAATRRSTSSSGCVTETPKPYTPSWADVVTFLDLYLKPR